MTRPRDALLVAVCDEGKIDVHAIDPSGNYTTLCGLDGDDESVGQSPAKLPRNPKITCHGCQLLIRAAKKYRVSDLAE